MSCPGCAASAPAAFIEEHREPIQGRRYRIGSCPDCGLAYAEPRELPGVEWYARAHSGETVAQSGDWRHERFFESVRPGKLIDLGCGAGSFLAEAQRRGFDAFGVDFNPDYIARGRAMGVRCELVSDFGRFLSSPGGPYSCAALFDVLEHVPEPLDFLKSVARLLSPGGALAISVPNGARPMPCASWRESFDYPPYHFTRWTEKSLRICLDKAGFNAGAVRFSPLHLGYFAGLAYYRLLRAVFPLMKRLILGVPPSRSDKTWSDLLPPSQSLLSRPSFRQRLVDAGLIVITLISLPLELPLWLWHRIIQPRKGRTLFVLAIRK